MIRVALGGVLAAVAMTNGTAAADLIVDEPIYEEAMAAAGDWTGFYVGVGAGGIWGSFDSVSSPATHEMDDVTPLDGTGWVAGVDAGYDWQMDSFIFGLQAEANWSNLSADFVSADPEWHASLDWYAALSAKAGFAADNFQVYGKAGVAVAGMSLSGLDNADPSAGTITATNTNFGWVAGIGAEVMATDNLSLFAEYEHLDFGASEYDITGTGYHAVEDMSATADVIKAGIRFRP